MEAIYIYSIISVQFSWTTIKEAINKKIEIFIHRYIQKS